MSALGNLCLQSQAIKFPDTSPLIKTKSGIQIPNSPPGANRESSCRLRYVQYDRLQQRPVIGIHQRDLCPAGIAVV